MPREDRLPLLMVYNPEKHLAPLTRLERVAYGCSRKEVTVVARGPTVSLQGSPLTSVSSDKGRRRPREARNRRSEGGFK